MKSIIRNFIAKLMAGRSDDGIMITLKDPQKVTLAENIMMDTLMRNGIDPRSITSEAQLKNILQQIKNAEAAAIRNTGIRNTESAKVFDLEGKQIPPGSRIMGGKAVDDMPPPGSRGGADDIAAPVQSSEETLKNMIEAENKKNIDKIKERSKNKPEPEDKADGGRIGFFMGSKFPKGLATLREMVKFFSKDNRPGSEILRLVNPKAFNKLLEDPNIYRKFDIQKGIGAPELIKNMQADMAKNRTMMVEEILSAAKNIRQSDIGTMERKKEIVEEMMKRGVDRETAEDMADTLSKMAESAAGKLDTPKLTDEGILELENILKNMETGGKDKRSLNADGGRIGFKDGMTRRTFLKLLGGLAAIPIVGKIIKPLKTVKGVKNVPIIKTDNVPGKPEWFDQLVNKVIIEGDDVTKKFATKEREIVHAKQIDEDNYVTVTQDLDEGVVRVEYENPQATMFGEKVDLTYKKPLPDEGDPRPVGEFQTTESGIVGRAQGPDDYDLEIEGMSGRAIEDLESDVSKLKEYATGKKPTLKEIVQNKKRKDKVKYYETPEGQSEYVVQRQGEYDYSPDDGMASGGIARMLGE